MPEISTKISPRIAELLQAGVITITTSWFASGSETYGRVTQPHSRLGIYPHESYILSELESALEKVQVPTIAVPSGSGRGPRASPVPGGSSVKVDTAWDGGSRVPIAITIAGTRSALPKDSLTWRELRYLGDDQLNRRLVSIGKEMGGDKAVSRLATVPSLRLTRAQNTLHGWWLAASPKQRFDLVTLSKKVGQVPRGCEENDLLARLGAGQYPFRGTDMQIQEDETEEEAEEAESSFKGLTIHFSDSE